jgi:hypothetical protein
MSNLLERIDMFLIDENMKVVYNCKACPYNARCNEKDMKGSKIPHNCTLPRDGASSKFKK